MIEEGNLFQENTGVAQQEEVNLNAMNGVERVWKLTRIKELYRYFRSCLLGRARDKWARVLEESDNIDNHEADNVYGAWALYDQQKELVSKIFEVELVENIKVSLMNTY